MARLLRFLLPNSLALGLGAIAALPGLAHTVRTANDVAATFHLEPDHNPTAGQPAQVWFLLTRRGGESIPLEACDCELAVYPEPRALEAEPLLEPPLEAIAAERYENLPGAEVVFPRPGSYTLELRGQPKTEGDFQAFQFTYPVTVAVGQATSEPPEAVANQTAEGANAAIAEPGDRKLRQFPIAWTAAGAVAVVIAGGIALLVVSDRLSKP
ncbi:hypothetical protein [Geitlerinema sp. PCC 7407]|uniref:hypothetical protein n=1 Tax=Geitlerinema sp. PCC 7407 TaxID=1173025 RepID=UPI00029FF161|nr:hypothetical protein [Geitlerinema sp. PCC 7407]AFY67710.1 hypothetical protein GEI7407_3242 [Geitlerinema sp. PCC 7407]